jgi:DNA-binding transcriptional LysR family regulator
MELRHLRYFVAVAEELHFRRAAIRLNISQPPLSQQIQQMEEELGVILFERTNRRVELSGAGRLFLPEARATLEQADRARRIAMKAGAGELGELRLSMFPSAPLMPRISAGIRDYRESFPEVTLLLHEMESRDQIAALTERRVDIAIVRNAALPAEAGDVGVQLVATDRLVVAMRTGHPLLRRRGAIALRALSGEPFVFYGPKMGDTIPQLVRNLCRHAGFEPEISQLANANSTMIGLVAAGLGIAIIPSALARLAPPDIAIRPLKETETTVSAWALWQRPAEGPLLRGLLVRI